MERGHEPIYTANINMGMSALSLFYSTSLLTFQRQGFFSIASSVPTEVCGLLNPEALQVTTEESETCEMQNYLGGLHRWLEVSKYPISKKQKLCSRHFCLGSPIEL